MILDTDRIAGDQQYRDELRHRCLTDHFFLADMVGFDKFIPRIHQDAVNLYFPKNPKFSIEEQHRKKYRLHIDPRGTYKTTLGRVDSLQWILAFPEKITILNETATQPLAEAISLGIAKFFWKPRNRPATRLQLCFPELIVEKMPEGTWNTPVHDYNDLDFTLAFTSPLSTQSGWHPWVLNPDDMVDTRNSGIRASAEVRQGVISTHNTNKNTLRAGGYINMRGTRYHPQDLYGETLDKMDPEEWIVLIRGAVTVLNGQRLMPGEFPSENDVVVNFPEIPGMDYRSLKQRFHEDYESYMCQQQNDPQGGNVPTFDEVLYGTILTPPERIPQLGDGYVCWRLPYGGRNFMRNAEGAAARIWDGRVYVVDAWTGNYTPSRLAEKIVRECKRHQINSLLLEALPGTDYIETSIRNEAVRRNWSVQVQWYEFQEDDSARRERIRQLEPQARAGRLLISTAITRANDLRRQFLNFGIVPENGMMDAISRLAAKVPMSLLRSELDEDEAELQIQRRHQLTAQFVYGYSGVNALEEQRLREMEAQKAALAKIDSYGLTDILGGLDG
jgi:hypothetical protein